MTLGATFPYPIQLGRVPADREGPKAVSFITDDWGSAPADGSGAFNYYNFNLLSQFQTGQFTTVQSVLVDNSTCSRQVVLVSLESGERISCPPFSQTLAPLLAGPFPEFQLRAYGGYGLVTQGKTRLHFLNMQQGFSQQRSVSFRDNPFSLIPAPVSAAVANVAVTLLTIQGVSIPGAFIAFAGSGTIALISEIYLTLSSGAFAPGGVVTATFSTVPDGVLFAVPFIPNAAGAAILYQNNLAFDPPLISSDGTLLVALSAVPAGGVGVRATVTGGLIKVE